MKKNTSEQYFSWFNHIMVGKDYIYRMAGLSLRQDVIAWKKEPLHFWILIDKMAKTCGSGRKPVAVISWESISSRRNDWKTASSQNAIFSVAIEVKSSASWVFQTKDLAVFHCASGYVTSTSYPQIRTIIADYIFGSMPQHARPSDGCKMWIILK